jgi:hypothetical protein
VDELGQRVLVRGVVQNGFGVVDVSRYSSCDFGDPFERDSRFLQWVWSSFVLDDAAKCRLFRAKARRGKGQQGDWEVEGPELSVEGVLKQGVGSRFGKHSVDGDVSSLANS